MSGEILVHEMQRAGFHKTQDSYVALTRGNKTKHLIANTEDLIPGFTRPSGLPIKAMAVGKTTELETVRDRMKEIGDRVLKLWNASDFGKAGIK